MKLFHNLPPLHKLTPSGLERLKAQMYRRGRLAYVGDRGSPEAVHYLYEGYAGANVGDEIIYDTTSGLLSPAHCVFVGRFRTPFETLGAMLGVRRVEAAVLGGGTVRPSHMMDDPRFKRRRLPLFTFGLGGVGFCNEDQQHVQANDADFWKRFLDSVEVRLFGVRGPASFARFRPLVPEAVVTGDTAIAAYNCIEDRKHEFIGVNFGYHFAEYNSDTIAKYKRIVSNLLGLGLPVVLIPMHGSDLTLMTKLLGEFSSSQLNALSWLKFVPSPQQFRGMLGRMAFGVGERLHFAVPLIASGIPCAMLGYSAKHRDFADAVGADLYCVGPRSWQEDDVVSVVTGIVARQCVLEAEIRQRVAQSRETLLKMFGAVRDEMLNLGR
jgi:polysaccharide pyruvyl transferase WcaK-like protein